MAGGSQQDVSSFLSFGHINNLNNQHVVSNSMKKSKTTTHYLEIPNQSWSLMNFSVFLPYVLALLRFFPICFWGDMNECNDPSNSY